MGFEDTFSQEGSHIRNCLSASLRDFLSIGDSTLSPVSEIHIIAETHKNGPECVAGSRRQHVLASILSANPAPDDIARSMRERLKDILVGWRGMDARSRRELERIGFSITEDGPHYKLLYQGDDRYTFPLPKSGSDHRGGLNAASDIGRFLF